MAEKINEQDKYNVFIESEDEDVLENLENIEYNEYLSSNDDSESEDTGQTMKAKRCRTNERKWEEGNFSPQIIPFENPPSGIQQGCKMDTALDYFTLFFNADIMNCIVTETNRYAGQIKQDVSSKSKMQKWVDTDISEMYVFLATVMLTSLIGKNSMKEYWSCNPIIATPFFRELFSQDRFFLLLRTIHFADNTIPSTDRLYKIRKLLDSIIKTYKAVFYPFQNICIDESFLFWKGHLPFRYYIPSKKHRSITAIKFFVCCDVKTRYILDLIIDTGSPDTTIGNEIGISGSVVTTMMRDYLGKGHRLFINNCYTSPALFDYLLENQTHACGTIQRSQKDFPEFPKGKKKRGYVKFMHSGSLLALKWIDKSEVYMITNMHEPKMIVSETINHRTGEIISKPEAILDYNKNMGTVTKSDMMISVTDNSRKTFKWYKKIFFRLLDISTMNAYNLYQVKTGKKPKLNDFRLCIITQIVEQYHKARKTNFGGGRLRENPIRLTARHFPHPIPQTNKTTKTRRQCFVCHHTEKRPTRRKETRFMCTPCSVPLCVYPCFKMYHTEIKF